MRSRVTVSFIVLALMAVACGGAPAASPGASAAPGASAPASQAASAEPPASAAPVADTLQMHWLGDCTCIWHPAAYETFSQAINFEMMFSTLIDRGWEGDSWTPIPDLADSWEISPDGLVWTFYLHPGVLWHDGTPFTASDIEFTINRSMITPLRFTRAAWDALVGAKEAADGTADKVAGVRVIDDLTIELTLGEANADYFSDLADPNSVIVPRHILEPTDPKEVETIEFSTTAPIGTGPYKFIKYETDQYSQFEANPDYFRGVPKIKNIFVKRLLGDLAIAQLESGDLDLSVRLNPAEKSRLEQVPTLDVISTPGVGTFGPYFNMLLMTDVNTRKAIAYAVNAQGIVDNVFGAAGRVNRGVVPGMPPADDQEYFDYDPVKAKELLDSSSWDKNQPLRIVFDKSFAAVEQWVPIFAQDLEAIGFKTELIGLESTAAIEFYNKIDQWEVIIAQGGDQGVGPFRTQNYYNCDQVEPAVNKAYLKDCKIDELFLQARREVDDAARTEIFKQISKITNLAVDRISYWTTNALSAKAKGLEGVNIPPNTREFIVGVQYWTFTK